MEMKGLDDDVVSHILGCLDLDEDIARVAAVCRSWHRLVVLGRLWRRLCIIHFPELEVFQEVAGKSSAGECADSPGRNLSPEYLQHEHQVFCNFYHTLTRTPSTRKNYILNALHASSTDNSPSEDVSQTLYPNPKRRSGAPSYWSSTGQRSDNVPEFLTYRLVQPLCVVEEIKMRPFQAFFQPGRPIYSSKSVRFNFGLNQPSLHNTRAHSWSDAPADRNYVWKYVSPLYTVEQADTRQTFRLPRPVVCVGGIFQVELIGRIQKQATDQLYYICICHVAVKGRALHLYDFEIKDPKHFILKPIQGLREEDNHDEEEEDEDEEDEGINEEQYLPEFIMWGRPIYDVEDEDDRED